MKIFFTISLVLAAVSGCLAAPPGAIELLIDTDFRRGLESRDRAGVPVEIRWGAEAERPVWRVAQHHSRSNVTETAWQTIKEGRFTFRDEWQWLSFNPAGQDADVILGVNSSIEYEGKFRSHGDPWPHLFLSQRMGLPGDRTGTDGLRLTDLAGLEFGLSLRLLYDRRNAGAGHDPRIHAAQFVFFLTVRNANEQSPGHGDYYWFGVMLYDDRYSLTSLRAQRYGGSPRKRGTEKLIYDIGLAPFTDAVVASGEWVEVGGEFAGGGVALRNAPAFGDAGAEERASGILARGEATDLNSSSIEPQTPRHGDLRRRLGPLLGSSWCLCTSVVHARLSWSLCGFGSLDVLIDSLWPNVKDQPRPSRAVGSSAWLGCIGFPIPNQAKFTAMLSAVPQIKIYQILIRNSGLSRHSFKIINDIIL